MEQEVSDGMRSGSFLSPGGGGGRTEGPLPRLSSGTEEQDPGGS